MERKESIRRKKEIDSVIENLDYQASSPDEKALVEACGKIGFMFVGEQDDTIVIKLQMNNNVSLCAKGTFMTNRQYFIFNFFLEGIHKTTVWRKGDTISAVVCSGIFIGSQANEYDCSRL